MSEQIIDVEKIIREYIASLFHLSLASCSDNKPWVCEVHFAYDDRLNLYFASLPTRRHSLEILKNPFIAGNIVKEHALDDPAVGVYFEGVAHKLINKDDITNTCKLYTSRLGRDEAFLDELLSDSGHDMYKIQVENWYIFGRFGQPHGQKYQLSWKRP